MQHIAESLFRNDSNELFKRKDIVAFIGLLTIQWSRIEQELAFLHAYLLGQREVKDDYGNAVDAYGVSIFFAIPSLHQKLLLLKSCIEHRISGVAATYFEKNTAKLVQAAANQRKKFVHTGMRHKDTSLDVLIADPLVGDSFEIRVKDLHEAMDSLEAAWISVIRFHEMCRYCLNKSHQLALSEPLW